MRKVRKGLLVTAQRADHRAPRRRHRLGPERERRRRPRSAAPSGTGRRDVHRGHHQRHAHGQPVEGDRVARVRGPCAQLRPPRELRQVDPAGVARRRGELDPVAGRAHVDLQHPPRHDVAGRAAVHRRRHRLHLQQDHRLQPRQLARLPGARLHATRSPRRARRSWCGRRTSRRARRSGRRGSTSRRSTSGARRPCDDINKAPFFEDGKRWSAAARSSSPSGTRARTGR